jgi:hypothetical protein
MSSPAYKDLFGAAGESVPHVDPEDLKALFEYQSVRLGVQLGFEAGKHMCKNGSDAFAIGHRCMMLGMLTHESINALAEWTTNEKLNDAVYQVMAVFPLEYMAVGVPRQWLPFDVEEFLRQVAEKARRS